jgi:hypothetical protein
MGLVVSARWWTKTISKSGEVIHLEQKLQLCSCTLETLRPGGVVKVPVCGAA